MPSNLAKRTQIFTYGGFVWQETGVYEPNGAIPGYVTGSGSNLAFFGIGYDPSNAPVSAADGQFTFLGANFVSAFNAVMPITAEAFDNGVSLGTVTFKATAGVPQFVDFSGFANFADIDQITFLGTQLFRI